MSGISSLFDLLALVYIFRSVQLGVQIWRKRVTLMQPPLTRHKKQTAEQAAFFIAVPISVFVHEGFHALAVWLVGGEVLNFAYRVFWGFVQHVGQYTPPERWFISLAGTVGSLLTGLAFWLIFRHNRSPSLRYFGKRALRFQIYFSLIYYPLFTLFGFDGDWLSIYDFGATPILSAATAVAHATILLITYRADRNGWFEMPSFESAQSEQAYNELASAVADQPDNTQLQLAAIDSLRRGGAERQARHALTSYLTAHPDSAEATLQLAAIEAGRQSEVSRAASDTAAKALSLGLANPRQAAYAHQLIGQHALVVGQYEQAIHAFTDALGQIQTAANSRDTAYRAQLYALRAQSYRRTNQHNMATHDIQEAVRLSQAIGDTQSAATYQAEAAIIQQQSS